MALLDYQTIADRSEEIFFELLRERAILLNPSATGIDAKTVELEVNDQLHAEVPAFAPGRFKVASATAIQGSTYPAWHFEFELVDGLGQRIGSSWTTDYAKSDTLTPEEQKIVDDVSADTTKE